MKNSAFSKRVRQDCRLLRQTLFKLLFPRFARWIVLIGLATVGGGYVAFRILTFGAMVDYSALPGLGTSMVAFLNRFNPYLWWGVVLFWAWGIFLALRRGWRRSLEQARLRPVHMGIMVPLGEALCAEVVDVMRWCWDSREEPFSVGDLQRAIWEIRHGRIDKIALTCKQEGVLGIHPMPKGEKSRAPLVEKPVGSSRDHEEAHGVLLRRENVVEPRNEPHLAPMINLPGQA